MEITKLVLSDKGFRGGAEREEESLRRGTEEVGITTLVLSDKGFLLLFDEVSGPLLSDSASIASHARTLFSSRIYIPNGEGERCAVEEFVSMAAKFAEIEKLERDARSRENSR